MPGVQQRQGDGAGKENSACKVNGVVQAECDAACHDQHRPKGDGSADEAPATVGVADDASEE